MPSRSDHVCLLRLCLRKNVFQIRLLAGTMQRRRSGEMHYTRGSTAVWVFAVILHYRFGWSKKHNVMGVDDIVFMTPRLLGL